MHFNILSGFQADQFHHSWPVRLYLGHFHFIRWVVGKLLKKMLMVLYLELSVFTKSCVFVCTLYEWWSFPIRNSVNSQWSQTPAKHCWRKTVIFHLFMTYRILFSYSLRLALNSIIVCVCLCGYGCGCVWCACVRASVSECVCWTTVSSFINKFPPVAPVCFYCFFVDLFLFLNCFFLAKNHQEKIKTAGWHHDTVNCVAKSCCT